MKKKIKKYGNTVIVQFSKDEQEIYGLSEGDVIDLEINTTYEDD